MAVMVSSAPVLPVSSEENLIVAARDGDDRALEELYSRYRDRISAYIHRRIADHGRAEDVAQEVFISALRRLQASDQPIVFKPWIYEIAKNACIDEHRRSVRNREVSLDAEADLPGGRRPLLSVAPTPPAVLDSKQQMQDLRGAFGGLSDSHHRLLVMREFEGLSYDEIGARMGMSRQMVESALFRARRKLGAEYDELSSGRRCQQVQAAIDSGRVHAYRSMGVRERRQLARHLAHCQPCRMSARLAGADEDFVRPRGMGAKIAAFFPFPLWDWWRGLASRAAIRSGANSSTAQVVDAASQSGASAAFTGAAVAVAALAIAASGGQGSALAQHGRPHSRPSSALASHSPATDPGVSPRHGDGPLVTSRRPRPVRLTRRSSPSPRPAQAGPRTAPASPAPPAAATPTGANGQSAASPSRPGGVPSVAAPRVTTPAPALPPAVTHTVSGVVNSTPVSGVVANPVHVPISVPSVPATASSATAPVVHAHAVGLTAVAHGVPAPLG